MQRAARHGAGTAAQRSVYLSSLPALLSVRLRSASRGVARQCVVPNGGPLCEEDAKKFEEKRERKFLTLRQTPVEPWVGNPPRGGAWSAPGLPTPPALPPGGRCLSASKRQVGDSSARRTSSPRTRAGGRGAGQQRDSSRLARHGFIWEVSGAAYRVGSISRLTRLARSSGPRGPSHGVGAWRRGRAALLRQGSEGGRGAARDCEAVPRDQKVYIQARSDIERVRQTNAEGGCGGNPWAARRSQYLQVDKKAVVAHCPNMARPAARILHVDPLIGCLAVRPAAARPGTTATAQPFSGSSHSPPRLHQFWRACR